MNFNVHFTDVKMNDTFFWDIFTYCVMEVVKAQDERDIDKG